MGVVPPAFGGTPRGGLILDKLQSFLANPRDGGWIQAKFPVTLANNTAKTIDFDVPDGYVFEFYGGWAENPDNVDRVIQVMVVDSAGDPLVRFSGGTVGATANRSIPAAYDLNVTDGSLLHLAHNARFPVVGPNALRFYWAAGGASAGGTGYYAFTGRLERI